MEPLRIVQLIDSLDLGGAERMAVNYANALAKRLAFSGLVATRKEGLLKEAIDANVTYLFLARTKTLDLRAVCRLKKFCKQHRVTHIQAHSSSYFLACMVKLLLPKVHIIWHDHNGLSEFVSIKKLRVLQVLSLLFGGIIAVNDPLKKWALRELQCSKVIYLPNFVTVEASQGGMQLKGQVGKRVLCLANLRFQKNQSLFLEVAQALHATHPDWTFHLVGKGFGDAYEQELVQQWTENHMQSYVFFYGACSDSSSCMQQATIGVLTSRSEGLPLVVLEYGCHQKPVVVTAVGELPLIIEHGVNGGLVAPHDTAAFVATLRELMDHPELQHAWGQALQATVQKQYTEEAVLQQYLTWMNLR